ncbi:MAG: bifunctional UDP-N-acetylglucosamine diphosphorylase/glucosamine-1-phosphate N-acetyltransferase GlmU [Clostridiales bacterium]|nr:bifunctional UDP-N-acetylglucosamine diphosphorylase/glucosamine-1-phosphate N-acetyltransferase GlmU [Clostridiales bacterium]
MKCAIILAGGKGTRMKSEMPKVMCEVLFEPMLAYVLRAVKEAGCEDVCVVTGYGSEIVESYLAGSVKTCLQSPQMGTGHAVMAAGDFINEHLADDIVILCGDNPMMSPTEINNAYEYHKKGGNAITLISAIADSTEGIGHVKRDASGRLIAIVEHKDANDEEKKIRESNAGTYWFSGEKLKWALSKISNNNSQHEYYLTDCLEILIKAGENAGAYVCQNNETVLAANDRLQLNALNTIMRRNINERLMLSGVDIPCTDGVIIGNEVKIGAGTRILPNTIILGATVIGSGCTIGANSYIKDSVIGSNVTLDNVKITDSTVADGVTCGPFVHIRANSRIEKNVHIGNFVEVKNSTLGAGTKSAHLTYIGDSDVGQNVNFGCGTVTVNYDGTNKHRCKIGSNAFLGCNTNLIAPVEIGNSAFTAAGSTITDNVPENALGVARARQVNKKDWVLKKKPYKWQKQQ